MRTPTPPARPPYRPPPPGGYGPGPEGHGGPADQYDNQRPGVVARYEDTGRFDVPPDYRWPPQAPPYGPPAPPAPTPAEAIAGFSRDTWVRMVIWILPLVFIAGTLYFNLQSSMARQDAMDAQVRALSDRVAGLASDQRVLQEHVQALRLNGDRIQPQLDGLKDQLNELRLDLGAIREKLGIVPKPRTN